MAFGSFSGFFSFFAILPSFFPSFLLFLLSFLSIDTIIPPYFAFPDLSSSFPMRYGEEARLPCLRAKMSSDLEMQKELLVSAQEKLHPRSIGKRLVGPSRRFFCWQGLKEC